VSRVSGVAQRFQRARGVTRRERLFVGEEGEEEEKEEE